MPYIDISGATFAEVRHRINAVLDDAEAGKYGPPEELYINISLKKYPARVDTSQFERPAGPGGL